MGNVRGKLKKIIVDKLGRSFHEDCEDIRSRYAGKNRVFKVQKI